MSIEYHKWETVAGRVLKPVLRIWNFQTGQYLSEPGYVDVFDSPESAQLATALFFGSIDADQIIQSRAVFDDKKVIGSVLVDPVKQGPFGTLRSAAVAASHCRWDDARAMFVVDPAALAKLSDIFQVGSMKAQTEMKDFVERYLHRANGQVAVRQTRIFTIQMLSTKKLPFYSNDPKVKASLRAASMSLV